MDCRRLFTCPRLRLKELEAINYFDELPDQDAFPYVPRYGGLFHHLCDALFLGHRPLERLVSRYLSAHITRFFLGKTLIAIYTLSKKSRNIL